MTFEVHQPTVIAPDHQLPALPGWRRRPRLAWIGGGVAVLALLLLVLSRRHTARAPALPPAPPRIPVVTTAARTGDIGVYLEAIGTVTPVHTAAITSQVTGQVVTVHYREGQHVEAGDPLVDIDARPYRATLRQAQGTVIRDRNILAEARMDLERYRLAWSRNAIAKQMLDDQEKVVQQALGTVQIDEGTVDFDQVQVDFCHITSPIAGRVGLRVVDPGNLVQATGNVTLAVVTQLQPITVVFTVSQDDLGPVLARLKQEAKLGVTALDRSGQRSIATGTLVTVDNQIDTATGTVKARAIFDNEDDALFPNQFVNTRLLVETHHAVTLVASSAIQQNGRDSYVYVVQDGVAHLRKVKTDVTDNGMTQVTGVQAGEAVADSSFDRLHDNAPVTIASAPTAAAGGGTSPP